MGQLRPWVRICLRLAPLALAGAAGAAVGVLIAIVAFSAWPPETAGPLDVLPTLARHLRFGAVSGPAAGLGVALVGHWIQCGSEPGSWWGPGLRTGGMR